MGATEKSDSHVLSSRLLSSLTSSLPNLLTLLSSPVDQNAWERALATPPLISSLPSGPSSTVELFELLSHYLTHTILAALFPNSVDNDKIIIHPIVIALLQLQRDAHITLLGIPWWIPIPQNSRAVFARRRLLAHLTQLLENESSEDVTPILGSDPSARPYVALGLLLRLSPAIWLSTWALARIIQHRPTEPSSLDQEVASLVKTWRDADIMGMRGATYARAQENTIRNLAAAMSTGAEGPSALTAAIREAETLYAGPGLSWQAFKVQKDFLLAAGPTSEPRDRWAIKRGEYVHLVRQLPAAITPPREREVSGGEKIAGRRQQDPGSESAIDRLMREFTIASVAGVLGLWDAKSVAAEVEIPKATFGLWICTPALREQMPVVMMRREDLEIVE
jgi:hypothetical protein